MEFKLSVYHRDTTTEELIEDLKNVAIKLKKNKVTRQEYEQHGKFHPSTLQRKIGSWFKILELANLEPTRSKFNIPDEDLFKNIENVWISLGRQPKATEVKQPLSKHGANTYARRFGSWQNALQKFVEYINLEAYEDRTDTELKEMLPEVNFENETLHKTKREISDRLRFRILMRDGFTCRKCGRSPIKEIGVELHIDHILPWSKGGETIPENLETKCMQCNLGKGNAFDV